jgi:hypothetical protein
MPPMTGTALILLYLRFVSLSTLSFQTLNKSAVDLFPNQTILLIHVKLSFQMIEGSIILFRCCMLINEPDVLLKVQTHWQFVLC